MDKYYECFVVPCKTPKCGTMIILQTLDEVELHSSTPRVTLVPPCKAFQEFCGHCKEVHTYYQTDIDVVVEPNRTPGWAAHSFAKARAEADKEIAVRENAPH